MAGILRTYVALYSYLQQFVGGGWRQQFVVTEAFKQIKLKICNKVLYFSK